jgi:hypothetical protein
MPRMILHELKKKEKENTKGLARERACNGQKLGIKNPKSDPISIVLLPFFFICSSFFFRFILLDSYCSIIPFLFRFILLHHSIPFLFRFILLHHPVRFVETENGWTIFIFNREWVIILGQNEVVMLLWR